MYEGSKSLRYHVVVLTWRVVECELAEDDADYVQEPSYLGFHPLPRKGTLRSSMLRHYYGDGEELFDQPHRGVQMPWSVMERRVWKQMIVQADGVESTREDTFHQALADMEANRQNAELAKTGSLLRVEK